MKENSTDYVMNDTIAVSGTMVLEVTDESPVGIHRSGGRDAKRGHYLNEKYDHWQVTQKVVSMALGIVPRASRVQIPSSRQAGAIHALLTHSLRIRL